MRAAFLLLPAIAMLAGCNAQPAAPTIAEQEAALRNEAADLKGWDRVFGVPSETMAKLNQFGFRLGAYEKAATGFAAKGAAITLSQSDAKNPNRGTVDVTGMDPAAIDRIVFTLPVTDEANADTAKKRLADIVSAFLFQYGIKGAGALDALAKEQAADGMIDAAPFAIAVTGDTPRRITVTLQRPTTSDEPAPAAGNTQQP
ncbi:hypothetical protein [Sphingomonas sp. LT1P40]|uniref:hypothetical protein n=1 Tax=Alteristakelama amylovorans TaxID=3096166 RepID=UPI002FC5CCC6